MEAIDHSGEKEWLTATGIYRDISPRWISSDRVVSASIRKKISLSKCLGTLPVFLVAISPYLTQRTHQLSTRCLAPSSGPLFNTPLNLRTPANNWKDTNLRPRTGCWPNGKKKKKQQRIDRKAIQWSWWGQYLENGIRYEAESARASTS